MNKKYIIAAFAIILTIAYFDLIDSFKLIDGTISKTIGTEIAPPNIKCKQKNNGLEKFASKFLK